MGIIIRQSIITTIISYAGVVLGFINLIYLYPKYLELNQVGLLRGIQDNAMLLVPFASFGLVQCISRFYPKFSSTQNSLNSFIGLLTTFAFVGFMVMVSVFFIFKSAIVSFFSEKAQEMANYLGTILWLSFTLLYIGLYEQFARSQLKIAVPTFLREVGIRFVQALLMFVYVMNAIDYSQFLFLSIFIYVICLVALIFYLKLYSTENILFRFSSINKSQLKEIGVFALVSFIGLSSVVLIAKIDSAMVIGIVGLDAAAIYTTAYYMASVIEIPKRAITTSATALLAHAFEKNEFPEIQKIYSKASINQLIIGALLFIGVWANLDNLFQVMPKGDRYSAGFWVVTIVGGAKLIDMAFGPSSEIIGLSKHYWFNLVVITSLAALIVVCNWILIPTYGITGAAYGTMISLVLYNGLKFLFIHFKLKLNPFTFNTIKVLVIALAVFYLNTLLPQMISPLVDMIIRSALIAFVYGTLILLWQCSDEVQQLYRKAMSMIGL